MADDTDNKVVMTERAGEPHPTHPEVIMMPWWKQALTRCARVYLQSLAGIWTAMGLPVASAVGVQLPPEPWKVLLAAIIMAILPAIYSLIQNSIEILTKLDSSSPQLRA